MYRITFMVYAHDARIGGERSGGVGTGARIFTCEHYVNIIVGGFGDTFDLTAEFYLFLYLIGVGIDYYDRVTRSGEEFAPRIYHATFGRAFGCECPVGAFYVCRRYGARCEVHDSDA